MKIIKNLLTALPIFLLLFSSCQNSDDDSSGGNDVNISPGQWRVSYFFDKKDETSDYAGYTFNFGSDGSLSATNGGQTWSGDWQTGFDDSTEKFLIDFDGAVPSALSELEEDWRIVKIEDNFMHFEHTSGGNGDTDVLQLTKL